MSAAIGVNKTCTKCGTLLPLASFYTSGRKVSGEPKHNSWCKTCISVKQAAYHKKTWGPEQLNFVAFRRTKTARSYLAYLRGKAIKRKQTSEFISLDALETLWIAQKGLCALTGWPMTMELGKGTVPTNCSIDRIDSSIGYEPGNVQLVCRAANVAKSNLMPSEFLALCKAVVTTHAE